MGILALLGVFLLAVIVLSFLFAFISNFRRALPGPLTLPVIAVPLYLLKESYLPRAIDSMYKDYGPVYEFHALGERLLVFTRPGDIEKILLASEYTGRITASGEEGLAQGNKKNL